MHEGMHILKFSRKCLDQSNKIPCLFMFADTFFQVSFLPSSSSFFPSSFSNLFSFFPEAMAPSAPTPYLANSQSFGSYSLPIVKAQSSRLPRWAIIPTLAARGPGRHRTNSLTCQCNFQLPFFLFLGISLTFCLN